MEYNTILLPQNFTDFKFGNDIIHTGIVKHSTGLDPYLKTREEMIHQSLNIGGTPQHMYIISDDEPKNGDKVIADNSVWDFKDETGFGSAPMPYWANKKTCKKIESTTDKKLGLPVIEKSDIEWYLNFLK